MSSSPDALAGILSFDREKTEEMVADAKTAADVKCSCGAPLTVWQVKRAGGLCDPCSEELERNRRAALRRAPTFEQAAKLDPECSGMSFASYDGRRNRGTERALEVVRSWPGDRSLILYGSNGIGKTHLAVAALRREHGKGKSVAFVNCDPTAFRLQFMEGQGSETRERRDLIDWAVRADVLALDDWRPGVPGKEAYADQVIPTIVDLRFRQGRRALIVTTNRDPRKLYGGSTDAAGRVETLADPRTWSRILDSRNGNPTIHRIEAGTDFRVQARP